MQSLTRKEFLALTALLSMPTWARADQSLDATGKAMEREKTVPLTPPKAELFPLSSVQLLDGPFQEAQQTDRTYLLTLEPDRLLAYIRQNAGLKPKAEHYGGWDTGGASTIGHYLSACSLMVAATGDPELKKRVDYIVSEMDTCQKAGDGGLYGFGWDKNTYFPSLAAGKVIPVNTSAWYLTHKLFAGLRDAYLLTGNTEARDVLVKMTDWADRVTSKLTPAQWQEMLGPPDKMGEYGGPHEVFADVYAITGDQKYLTLAEKFRHAITFDPLERGDGSALNGRHANSEIPKFVGYERIYELSGDPSWRTAAQNFWQNVADERTWANGGDGQWEHFFNPDEMEKNVDARCGPETCASYNMLKLTRQLYALSASVPYLDYYERTLYNSILPSQAPGGGFVYYTTMRPGHYRRYSRPFDAFWCCVGTGMENHGKYGELIYAHAPDRLFVNLFLPSVLTWQEQGLTLRQETMFPESPQTRLALTLTKPRKMTLSIRCPGWMAPGALKVHVNDKAMPVTAKPGSYVDIARTWKTGDTVDITLPMRLTTEPLPHSADRAAFFYGPILLAGKLGTEGLTRDDFYGGGDNTNIDNQLATKALPVSHFPVIVGTPAEAITNIRPVSGQPLVFQTHGAAKPSDITLIPFYKLYFERYALYWPVMSAADYAKQQQEAQELKRRTVDHVLVGEDASESAHHMVATESHVGSGGEPFTHWRDASGTGAFSYVLKSLPDRPLELHCAYWGSDSGRDFDIEIDGKVIATQHLTSEKPNAYLYVTYPIPLDLTQGKTQITVRFVPKPGRMAGGLFDCRLMLRA